MESGHGGRALLHDSTVLENMQYIYLVEDEKGNEGIEVDLSIQLSHKGALAVARLKNSQGNQMLNAFPNGGSAHAHCPSKLIFRGQFTPRRPGATQNLVAKLPEDLATDTLFSDGLEHVDRGMVLFDCMISDIISPVKHLFRFFVFLKRAF